MDDLDRLDRLVLGDAQVDGQLGDGRRAPQGVGQLVQGLAEAQRALLHRPRDVHPPAGVAQVALDLADHAGHGVGHERVAVVGVVAVDGRDQADPGRLAQVLGLAPRLLR